MSSSLVTLAGGGVRRFASTISAHGTQALSQSPCPCREALGGFKRRKRATDACSGQSLAQMNWAE
jgi:hypothetical protein